MWFEIIALFLLIMVNGVFAMSELAMFSARPARLKALADEGHRGAKVALKLIAEPGRFLSTVQIGITLIGIFAGAYGGATFSKPLALWLIGLSVTTQWAEFLAFGFVIAIITYLSLVIGELVPKRMALKYAETLAITIAIPMALLAKIAAPLVWLLDVSTRLSLKLLGDSDSHSTQKVTEDELKALLHEATEAGVVEVAEQAMISGVMRLADRPVKMLMTPRPDIVWVDLDDPLADVLQCILSSPHSRMPAARADLDGFEGVLLARDLLAQTLSGKTLDLRSAISDIPVLHEDTEALDALDILKRSAAHMALVVDEYGSVQGLVTATDMLAAITGGFDEETIEQPDIIVREDGSWLIDGSLPVDELKECLNLKHWQPEDEYHTLAGLILAELEHLPVIGESLHWQGYRLEIVDMDERRIDRVWVSLLSQHTLQGE